MLRADSSGGNARARQSDRESRAARSTTRSSTVPVVVGTEDEHAIDIGKLRAQTGLRDARPGVHEHRLDEERHHVPRRRARASCATAASRSRSSPRSRPSSRSPTCSSTATCRTRRSSTRFSHAAHAPLADPRGHEALLRRLSRRRPTRWRSCRRWCCSLSSFYPRGARRGEHARSMDVDHRAPAVEGADDRGVLVQEVDRPAVRLPEEHASATARTSST